MIPLLAASEKGRGQAESSLEIEIDMWWNNMTKSMSRSLLERSTVEGDSPVDFVDMNDPKRVVYPRLDVWIQRN